MHHGDLLSNDSDDCLDCKVVSFCGTEWLGNTSMFLLGSSVNKCSFLKYLPRPAFVLLKIDQMSHLPQWATMVQEQESVAEAEEYFTPTFLRNPHSSVNLQFRILNYSSTVARLEYLQVPQNLSFLLTSVSFEVANCFSHHP